MIIYSQSPASLHRASSLVDGQSVRGVIGPRDSQRPIAALPRPSLSRCRRWRGGSARAVIGGISCEWRAAGRRVEVRVPGGWERGRCPHESRSWNAVVRHRGRWGAGSRTPCSWRSPFNVQIHTALSASFGESVGKSALWISSGPVFPPARRNSPPNSHINRELSSESWSTRGGTETETESCYRTTTLNSASVALTPSRKCCLRFFCFLVFSISFILPFFSLALLFLFGTVDMRLQDVSAHSLCWWEITKWCESSCRGRCAQNNLGKKKKHQQENKQNKNTQTWICNEYIYFWLFKLGFFFLHIFV